MMYTEICRHKSVNVVMYEERPKMKRDAQLKAVFSLGKRLLSVGHLPLFLGVRRTYTALENLFCTAENPTTLFKALGKKNWHTKNSQYPSPATGSARKRHLEPYKRTN